MDSIPNCRACLRPSLSYIDLETTFEQNVVGISLEIQPAAYTTFMDCFRFCTQLKAAECEEEMPQSICEQCGLELSISWNFLKKAVSSDQILRNSLDNLTEYHTREVLVDSENGDCCQISGAEIEQIKDPTDNDSYLADSKENMIYECNTKEENIYKKDSQSECEQEDEIHETNSDTNDEESDNYTIKLEQGEALHSSKTLELPQDTEQIATTSIRNNSLSNLVDDDYYVLEVLDTDTKVNTDEATTDSNQFEHIICNVSYENDIDSKVATGDEAGTIYECPTCFQTFDSRRALSHHSREHISIERKSDICKICDQKITKKETMRKHLKNLHSNIVNCSQCDYQCPAFKMADHVHRSHGEPSKLACNICGKTFVHQSTLNSHVKYHQRKEANIKSDACEICGKRFSTQHYLRLHMDVHCNERQLHQCDFCEKIYISKIALENHVRLHRGETIKCDQCGKQFVRKYELNVHLRFHTRDYPFKCEVCDKKFAIKGHLRTHMWRHQGLKLQCEECGKLFTSTKALQEHSFVHTEMPFPCTYCGRGYPSKQKFKVHLKTTHLVELTEDELLKITKLKIPQPLQRKKLTLVQADSVMKEVEVKDGEDETTANEGDLFVELC